MSPVRRDRLQARAIGETATLYGETRYAARRWDRKRRIIMTAEVLCYPGRARKDNPRFLVTNLPDRPATIYTRLYCGRGDMENRLKELQHGLAMDRTSCSRFVANHLRLLFSVAAYALFQTLQTCARATEIGAAQVRQAAAHGVERVVDGDPRCPRLAGIGVDGEHDLAVVEDARPRHDRAQLADDRLREPEVDAVAGDLPQELTAPPQCQPLAPERVDLRQLTVDTVALAETVPAAAAKRAELAAEHRFADVAVVAALAARRLRRPGG